MFALSGKEGKRLRSLVQFISVPSSYLRNFQFIYFLTRVPETEKRQFQTAVDLTAMGSDLRPRASLTDRISGGERFPSTIVCSSLGLKR